MSKTITLTEYIENVGRTKISKDLRVTRQIVANWSTHINPPSVKYAAQLIKHSKGLLDYNSIYKPYSDYRKFN